VLDFLTRLQLIAPLLVLALCVAPPQRVGAERLEDIPNPRERDGTWITDLAGALRPDTILQVNGLLTKLEQDTTAEGTVVVIRTLDGQVIEEFAARLFERWGIGKKDRDNGFLFLWSTGDRRVRVEVGYGLEAVLPDGKVGAILDQYVIPQFKAGDFDAGVVQGVEALATVIRNEPLDLQSQASNAYEPGWSPLALVLGVLGLVPASLGGLIGYRKWRRYRRRTCPECHGKMVRLGEDQEDRLLEPPQQLEEKLVSVDYDVWSCPACLHHFSLRYPKRFSRYAKCPQCGYRTKSSVEKTLKAATTTRAGKAQVTEKCEFCTYHHTYQRTLPKVSTSSSSSGGGSSSGGSSSSSFGGGSSGGGGASRGY
jgi:uncharacterized protein